MRDLNHIEWFPAIPRTERTGENDPNGKPNNLDKANKQIWAVETVEHDKDGDHKADLIASSFKIEFGFYTGTGVDDRTVNLEDSALTINILKIWTELPDISTVQATKWTTTQMQTIAPGMSTSAWDENFFDNGIQDLGTGSFQLGDYDWVNKVDVKYYYMAMGV